ncbi:MAG: hypothetical protein ACOVOQ_11980 [Flavobacterium sp.]|jgi:hypothetical protein
MSYTVIPYATVTSFPIIISLLEIRFVPQILTLSLTLINPILELKIKRGSAFNKLKVKTIPLVKSAFGSLNEEQLMPLQNNIFIPVDLVVE